MGKKEEDTQEINLGNTRKLLFLSNYESMKRLAGKREEWVQQ